MKKLDESTEETKEIIEGWRKQASEQTLETLPAFLDKLMNDYVHDYGTICHALSIGGTATMWAMNNHKQGGITGFQAGAIMWENIQNWMTQYRGKPMVLVNYEELLYPQYAYKFNKEITEDTWSYLQKEAKKRLDKDGGTMNVKVREHMQSIVDGIPPFGYIVVKER